MGTIFLYIPSEYGRIAIGIAFSLLLFSLDCLLCVSWERYFALIKLESGDKLFKYRIIVYTIVTANCCLTSLGYVLILVKITSTIAHDKLHEPNNIDLDYFKTLEIHTNIFAMERLRPETVQWIVGLGLYATCSRTAIGVTALWLFKNHINNSNVSNSTLVIVRIMDRLVYIQIIIIFGLAVIPAWFMVILLFVLNNIKYVSEMFMAVVLVISLSPMALAISTICAYY
uniref:G protein-coupled receptor n=1 Tax=Panagrellus redivivus TaxID=6233 RepID=A0A7E4UQW1_PANRE